MPSYHANFSIEIELQWLVSVYAPKIIEEIKLMLSVRQETGRVFVFPR